MAVFTKFLGKLDTRNQNEAIQKLEAHINYMQQQMELYASLQDKKLRELSKNGGK